MTWNPDVPTIPMLVKCNCMWIIIIKKFVNHLTIQQLAEELQYEIERTREQFMLLNKKDEIWNSDTTHTTPLASTGSETSQATGMLWKHHPFSSWVWTRIRVQRLKNVLTKLVNHPQICQRFSEKVRRSLSSYSFSSVREIYAGF